MDFAKLAPNWELLKSPFNWFVIAFSVILLILAVHFLIGNKGKD